MNITIGAVGPGEVIDLEFTAPAGVDFTTATKTVQCSLSIEQGPPVTLTPWTTVDVTATRWIVRYTPTGAEFGALGNYLIVPDLVLNSVTYRYASVSGRVVAR